MSRYRIIERVGDHYERVEAYADLERHHPDSGRQPGRSYATLNGELEEVRHLDDGRLLVKKDFILLRDPAGPVYVPAPVSGYVHHLNDATNAIRIYDQPNGQQDARLLAQSLHMQLGSSPPDGSWIDYGMPLGRMGDVGSPGSVHVHLEAEHNWYRRYIEDINVGNITPERYPMALPPAQTSPAASTLAVRDVQRTLNQLGYLDQAGQALAVDGVAGARSAHAVRAFQRDHQLAPDAVAGPLTAAALSVALVESPRRGAARPVGLLRQGSTGAEVRLVQSILGRLGYEPEPGRRLMVDGSFGPATARSVHEFQLAHGLAPDRIVGDRTRAALAASMGNPLISERTHLQHHLFQQATMALQRADDGAGRAVVAPEQRRNVAANLALAAHQRGLRWIDTVLANATGERLFAVHGGPQDPAQRHAHVDLVHASLPPAAGVVQAVAMDGGRGGDPVIETTARARAFAP